MATKRMISNEVIRTDDFVKMSQGAQLLYFYLNMTADDDGFNAAPIQEMNRAKASEEDMKQLINHKYIIVFESGVIVVRHWLINNQLSKDKYHSTIYDDEKQQLGAGKNGQYELLELLPYGAKSLTKMQADKGDVPLAKKDLVNEFKSVEFKNDSSFLPEDVNYELDSYPREEERSKEKNREEEREETALTNLSNLYGEMNNVFLLPDEYKKICDTYENHNLLLDKISHYLNNTTRVYRSHYSLIQKIAIEENWVKKRKRHTEHIQSTEVTRSSHDLEIEEIMQEQEISREAAERIYKKMTEDAKKRALDKAYKLRSE